MALDPMEAERERLTAMLEELHPSAFLWSLHCCGGDRFEAEDVLHTTYLKVLDGSARFRGRSSPRTWLFAVIRFTARETRRRVARRLRLLAARAGLVALSDDGSLPWRRIAASEERRHVERGLAALSSRQSDVLRLVFYHDLTVDQAAAVIGISPGSARVHYERGKARLRKTLALREVTHEDTRRAADQTSL